MILNNKILYFVLFVLLCSFVSATTYTRDSSTDCIDNICTTALYGGVRFVEEDKQWKPIENARSLKDKGFKVIFLENDKDFPLEVVDFNLTSITVDLVKKDIVEQDIPIRIWKRNDSIEKENELSQMNPQDITYKDRFDKTVETKEKFGILEIADKRRTYSLGINDILEYGFSSTTVILQTADTENMDDTHVNSYITTDDVNYGDVVEMQAFDDGTYTSNMVLRFNLSSLQISSIISSNLSLYLNDNNLDSGEEFRTHIHHLYNNFSWNEHTMTWNTGRPSNSDYNVSSSDNIAFTSAFGTGRYYWNTTDILNIGFNQNSVSFYMISIEATPVSGLTDHLDFNSKEAGSNMPILGLIYIRELYLDITLLENQTILEPYYINLTSNETIVCSINDTYWNFTNVTTPTGTNYSFYNNTFIPDGYYSILINCTDLDGNVPSSITINLYANVAPLTITSRNIYDDTEFDSFSAYINHTWEHIDSGDTILVNPGAHYITYNKTGVYFNQTYNLTIGVFPTWHQYNTSQSILNIRVTDLLTDANLTNFNVSITNQDSGQTDTIYNDYSNITIFYINGTDYSINITHSFYEPYNGEFTIAAEVNVTMVYNLSNLANLTIFDEATEGLFNLSSADSIEILVFCPDRTYSIDINATTTIFPVSCEYTKFKFILDYDGTTYYRTLIIPPEDIYDIPLYLINLDTDTAIYSTFTINDLYNDYDGASIYIKKAIGNGTFIITADFVDIENKIGTYLIENNEYILELHSINQPLRVLGVYNADVAGDKNIRVYDIVIDSFSESASTTITWGMQIQNRTGNDSYVEAFYRDTGNNTNSVIFNVWEDAYGDVNLFSHTTTGNATYIEYEFNVTSYMDSNLFGTFTIINTLLTPNNQTFGKILNAPTEIIVSMFDDLRPNTLQWFFTLLIGSIALAASIKTGNYVSLLVVGIAALFTAFGWYTINVGILALLGLVSILTIFKKGEKEPVT